MSVNNNIWELLVKRNPDQGGVVFLATGRMGSGKTSLLLNIARQILSQNNLGELTFWRGMFSAQFLKFDPWKLFVEKSLYDRLAFYERGRRIDPHVQEFSNFKELLKLAEPTYLNVVYFDDDLKWADFLSWLLVNNPGWCSLFLDEVEDICPSGVQGDAWQHNARFGSAVKEARKQRVSIYTVTQNPADCDWRFLRKVMMRGFLIGSRKEKGIRVWQRAIDALKLGEAWLVISGSFEKIAFEPYPPKRDVVVKRVELMETETGGVSAP